MIRLLFVNLIEVTVLIFICSVSLKELDYDYNLERVELIHGEKQTVFEMALRVARTKAGYFLNGTLDVLEDLGENYLANFEAGYSAMGNNMFSKSPFKIPPTPTCEFLNSTFKDHIQHNFFGKSNLPVIPPEGLCPFPKGHYYFKQVNFTDDLFPPHAPLGLWKIELLLLVKAENVGGIRFIFKTTSKA